MRNINSKHWEIASFKESFEDEVVPGVTDMPKFLAERLKTLKSVHESVIYQMAALQRLAADHRLGTLLPELPNQIVEEKNIELMETV